MSKKVTIINAYGDKNIGDAAILNVAIQLVEDVFKKPEISVHCESINSSTFVDNLKKVKKFELPYGYAIRGKTKVGSLIKVVRFLSIYVETYKYILLNRHLKIKLPSAGFYSYVSSIKNADLVIGMGGGYFTTNNSHKDYFGLMLTLLPVYIAKIYGKNIFFFPMSFGPFASRIQEKIAYNALKNTTVLSRDLITLKLIKNIDKKRTINTFYSPDLALFLEPKNYPISKKNESKYMVLTAREWFEDSYKQQRYESALVSLIKHARNKYNLKIIFIPMARNVIEDDDNRVAKRIVNQLKNKVKVQVVTPKSLAEVRTILMKAKVAVCTRMHSAILSTTVFTPFIAIGYGHKTLGFVKSFDIEKWHIDIGEVRKDNLLQSFDQLLIKTNYNQFINKIKYKQKEKIHFKKKILSSLASI